MFSANCMSCGMPPMFCPSLARLQAELGDWANAIKNAQGPAAAIENAACPSAIPFEEMKQLSLNALSATAFTMRGNGTMHPGPPSQALVAIGDFVTSGLATNHYKKRGFHGQFALPRRIDIPPKGAAVGATGRSRLRVGPAAQWSPNTHLQNTHVAPRRRTHHAAGGGPVCSATAWRRACVARAASRGLVEDLCLLGLVCFLRTRGCRSPRAGWRNPTGCRERHGRGPVSHTRMSIQAHQGLSVSVLHETTPDKATSMLHVDF